MGGNLILRYPSAERILEELRVLGLDLTETCGYEKNVGVAMVLNYH